MSFKVLVDYVESVFYRDEIELTKEEMESARADALKDFNRLYKGEQTFEDFFNINFAYYLDISPKLSFEPYESDNFEYLSFKVVEGEEKLPDDLNPFDKYR